MFVTAGLWIRLTERHQWAQLQEANILSELACEK